MKKTASGADIDAYIAGFPRDVADRLRQLRATIRSAAPHATETISYQMPTFVLHGNLVHFAAFAKHIGFYPAPSGIAAYPREIARYVHAKGSVQFPHDRPLPLALVAKIVRFRVKEAEAKASAGATRARKRSS